MKPIPQYQINLSYFESTYYKTPESLPEFKWKPSAKSNYLISISLLFDCVHLFTFQTWTWILPQTSGCKEIDTDFVSP